MNLLRLLSLIPLLCMVIFIILSTFNIVVPELVIIGSIAGFGGVAFVFYYFYYLSRKPSPPINIQNVIRCPKCGVELLSDIEFCPQCGAKLPQ